jgi:hypothetical protein
MLCFVSTKKTGTDNQFYIKELKLLLFISQSLYVFLYKPTGIERTPIYQANEF